MTENHPIEKKPYAKPQLVTHGSVEKLTERGHGHCDHDDHDHHDSHSSPGSNIWCK